MPTKATSSAKDKYCGLKKGQYVRLTKPYCSLRDTTSAFRIVELHKLFDYCACIDVGSSGCGYRQFGCPTTYNVPVEYLKLAKPVRRAEEKRSDVSWTEKQKLCAEYFACSGRISGMKCILRIGDFDPVTTWTNTNTADRIADEARRLRMDEIKKLVGQDALDQYEEQQKIRKELENVQAALRDVHDRLRAQRALLYTVCLILGVVAGFSIFA